MRLIKTINTFKKLYDGRNNWFLYYRCSVNVLEYYINNYDNIDWYALSCEQPLTEDFMDKYLDKLDFMVILDNTNINLSYEFLEKHLYQYNLYIVCSGIVEYNGEDAVHGLNLRYNSIFDKLKNKYPEKYQIDKLQWNLKSFT